MRSIIAGVAIVVLLSGCTSYGASKRVAQVGGVATLVGIGVMIGASAADNAGSSCGFNGDPGCLPLFLGGLFLLAVPGAILGASGLIGMGVHGGPIAPPSATLSMTPNNASVGEAGADDDPCDCQRRADGEVQCGDGRGPPRTRPRC